MLALLLAACAMLGKFSPQPQFPCLCNGSESGTTTQLAAVRTNWNTEVLISLVLGMSVAALIMITINVIIIFA